jgi:hypothetical protein
MDSSSSSSSSSDDEDGVFRNMSVALLTSDEAENEMAEEPRQMLLGGAGTRRSERKKPHMFNEAGANYTEQRRRKHLPSPWSIRFFTNPLAPCSLDFDAFRQKFRLPYPLFSLIVREARLCGLFPGETIQNRGHVPAPLHLQIVASLRYLATGRVVDGNEEAAGLGRSTMQGFMHDFFDWFVNRFYDEWITSK